jgi:PGF-pre-PGF domain-containing protein
MVGGVITLLCISLVGMSGIATANNHATVFEYNETPDESATIQPGGVYTHQFSVDTNATNGPLILVAYINQSTDISFESSNVVYEGSDFNVDVNVSNVTVAGDDLTRIQLTNRSDLQNDTARTLDVEMNFEVPSTTTTERIQTGGTHGPSGQVLRLEQTELSVERDDSSSSSSSGGGGGGGGFGLSSVVQPNQIATETLAAAGQQVEFTELARKNDQIKSITLDFGEIPEGDLTADILENPPARARTDYANRPVRAVVVAELTVPENVQSDSAEVQIALGRDHLRETGANPENLQVERYTGTQWQSLSTEVVNVGPDRVTISAETPGFSTFVVSVPSATQAQSATTTPAMTPETATETPSSGEAATTDTDESDQEVTTTASSTPGFGILVAGVALGFILGIGVWRQRR